MPADPKEWTEADRAKARWAIADRRLCPTDLYYWVSIDVDGRSIRDLAMETFLTESQVTRRVEAARAAIDAALARPDERRWLAKPPGR